MMDLVLINSPDTFDGEVRYKDNPRIPLGLMSIAAWVEQCGFTVKIYDCFAYSYSVDNIISELKEDQPKVVGINCYTANCFSVYSLCDRLRKTFPFLILVLGGPHPSCAPEHVFKHCISIDYIIIGQGEYPFSELLAHPNEGGAGCIKRTDFEKNGKKKMEPFGLPMGYNALPMPAYHLIDMEKYLACESQAYIASSRGCFYNCAFCCSKNVFNGCAQFRSAEQVLQEVDYLHKCYDIINYYFYDDNILLWQDLSLFGKGMYQRGFFWTAQAAIRDITQERVQSIKNSGCKRLSIGFESGSVKIQRYIGKTIPDNVEERIRLLIDAGIAVRGYFMIGFPDETADDVIDTAHLICHLRQAGMSDLSIFPVRPYPGTRLYEDCVKRFGQDDIDKFLYLEDYVDEKDPFLREKLKTYNTIGYKSICPAFTPRQIREIIKGLYRLFRQIPKNDEELKTLLFRKIIL